MSIHFSQIEVTNGLNLNQCGRNHKVIKAIQCVRGREGTWIKIKYTKRWLSRKAWTKQNQCSSPSPYWNIPNRQQNLWAPSLFLFIYFFWTQGTADHRSHSSLQKYRAEESNQIRCSSWASTEYSGCGHTWNHSFKQGNLIAALGILV